VTADCAVSIISAARGAQDNTATYSYLTRINRQDMLLEKLYPYRDADPTFFFGTRASAEEPKLSRIVLEISSVLTAE
jgi:hypothetical protein